MCNVYRSVGSLTTIKSHLQRNNVTELTSLNELIAFQKNYSTSRQQIISKHELSITQEKNDLNSEISKLDKLIKVKKTVIEEENADNQYGQTFFKNEIRFHKAPLGHFLKRMVNKERSQRRLEQGDLNFLLRSCNGCGKVW